MSPSKYGNKISELNSMRTDTQEIDMSETPGKDLPLLFIDINISPTETKRISIFENDTAQGLAEQFCMQHNLSQKMQVKLTAMLLEQMQDMDEIVRQQ